MTDDWIDEGCSCGTPGIVMSEHDERCTLRLCHRCGMVNPDHMPGDELCRPFTRLASRVGAQQRERASRLLHEKFNGVIPWGTLSDEMKSGYDDILTELLALLGEAGR